MTRTIVLTGASDGIGAAAARRLSAAGHTVVLVGRSPQKTAALAAEIGQPYRVADFARLAEVRALADDLRATYPRIDVLANNAGGIMGGREVTVDGNEMTLQVNHLAPFLLTHLLLPTLETSRATVIASSSRAARAFGRLDLDDLDHVRDYGADRAYGDSKLANILFTKELQRRYGPKGIAAVAFHPGVIATNFAEGSTSAMRLLYRTPLHRLLPGPDRGADQLVWLATTTPGQDWQPGQYYERRKVAATNPQADDAALAAALWRVSAERVGVPAD
ncbi:SDR family NAD(P)-dependent oxidoreductase [Georgenia faecalis]|uniref:SDR family NAD(P)-dependent oxidoreductase n=1 Tax=Georgenia faecalis TaxID=2483799 RepID=A0ABV9DBZ7_9MICO|nr:SDR family NAD(P)-dependent oxidoreductase [Georgenia faecalis]